MAFLAFATSALVLLGSNAFAADDLLAPTISLRSPEDGDWTTLGATSLIAEYGCVEQEGGSALEWCGGPSASGDPVPATSLGLLPFRVSACCDLAGHATSETTEYFVFRSVDGTVVGGKTARPGTGLTLTLEMGLPPGTDPLATIETQHVNCADGAALEAPEAAVTRVRITHSGGLSIRWDTDRAWAGQCRTLTSSFGAAGWVGATGSGPAATFGPVSFR
jgi:hypothetical protein